MSKTLKQELAEVLNRHGVENGSDTPDFVLAQYLVDCLGVFADAVSRRDKWHGFQPWPPPENVDTPRSTS